MNSTYEVRYARYELETDESGRAKFLSKLFSGDVVAMQTLIGEVLSSETWKIAAARIDRFYAKQGLEANSAVAMEFSHALNRTFR